MHTDKRTVYTQNRTTKEESESTYRSVLLPYSSRQGWWLKRGFSGNYEPGWGNYYLHLTDSLISVFQRLTDNPVKTSYGQLMFLTCGFPLGQMFFHSSPIPSFSRGSAVSSQSSLLIHQSSLFTELFIQTRYGGLELFGKDWTYS